MLLGAHHLCSCVELLGSDCGAGLENAPCMNAGPIVTFSTYFLHGGTVQYNGEENFAHYEHTSIVDDVEEAEPRRGRPPAEPPRHGSPAGCQHTLAARARALHLQAAPTALRAPTAEARQE